MKIVFVLSLYSAFERSIETENWNPEGMPAVAKLFESLKNSNINFTVIFVLRGKNESKIYSKKMNGFNNELYFISVKPIKKPFKFLYEYSIWQEIRKLQLDFSLKTIVYCDRANMVVGGLFAFFSKRKVLLRLHGITTYFHDSKSLKWKFFNFETYFAFKAPYAKVLISEDGTPGKQFVDKFFKKDVGVSLLNGTKLITIDDKSCVANKTNSILFVSRLDETKGVVDFLKLSQKLLDEFPDLKIIMIGDGPLRNLVFDFIGEIYSKDNFLYLGSLPHNLVYSYYLTSSIFISFNELGNLSNTMLEALSTGMIPITFKPCFETKRDLSTFSLLNGIAFFVDRDRRVQEAFDVISDLMGNPNKRRKIHYKVLNFSKNNLSSWEKRMANEINILQFL